jgi:hypothetical protein
MIGKGNVGELPIPTSPEFLISVPTANVYTDSSEAPQKTLKWYGQSLTLNYVNSYDSWYTDSDFSTYEIEGKENESITFVKECLDQLLAECPFKGFPIIMGKQSSPFVAKAA